MQRWVDLRQDATCIQPECPMTDFTDLLANLRRPRLLIRAARLGLEDYCRDRDLHRALPKTATGGSRQVMADLLGEEDRLEGKRKVGDASYSLTRHVEVLIALMSEARLMPTRSHLQAEP
jgi:hypothetical protein